MLTVKQPTSDIRMRQDLLELAALQLLSFPFTEMLKSCFGAAATSSQSCEPRYLGL